MTFPTTSIALPGGYVYPDPSVHDKQHWWASVAGLIAGATLFVTYYFFSRTDGGLPWKMPWYYYVVGLILSAFAVSSIACVLSTSIRAREA